MTLMGKRLSGNKQVCLCLHTLEFPFILGDFLNGFWNSDLISYFIILLLCFLVFEPCFLFTKEGCQPMIMKIKQHLGWPVILFIDFNDIKDLFLEMRFNYFIISQYLFMYMLISKQIRIRRNK